MQAEADEPNRLPLLVNVHFSLLLQPCEGFLDALQGFDDVLVACGIAHAEAFWRAESIAANSCNVTHFKQVHREVGAAIDDAVAILLSEETAALWEEIEGSLRVVHLEARYLLC